MDTPFNLFRNQCYQPLFQSHFFAFSRRPQLVSVEIIIERPEDIEQHLCADKAYDGNPAKQIIVSHGYIIHVRAHGEEILEKSNIPAWKARRWVVEVSRSWFNRFRKFLVRYEKRADTYTALLHMTAAIIASCKVGVIYG